MHKVLFLSDRPEVTTRDNVHTLPRVFAQAGWQVCIETHALSWRQGKVCAGKTCLTDVDLVWPLGLGDHGDFIDRMQLLAHSGARLINSPEAYLLLHGKLMWADLLPQTHASNRIGDLAEILAGSTGEWILKPAAGSFGRTKDFVTGARALSARIRRWFSGAGVSLGEKDRARVGHRSEPSPRQRTRRKNHRRRC